MKSVIVIIIGVLAGLYLGVWFGFIGGICQTIHGFNSISAIDIACGLARIFAICVLNNL